jgi:hypothetical protein
MIEPRRSSPDLLADLLTAGNRYHEELANFVQQYGGEAEVDSMTVVKSRVPLKYLGTHVKE